MLDDTPGAPLPPALPASGRRPLVLYIEDNEVNMMIVRELVRQRPDLDFDGAVDGGSVAVLADGSARKWWRRRRPMVTR